MPPHPGASSPPARATVAMFCSAAVTAQFVGGKAARDALFLNQFDVAWLPAMVVATSAVSLVVVAISSRGLRRWSPSVFVPASFAAAAVLLLAAWVLTWVSPAVAAPLVYLQISGAGPMLGSGFWLIAGESFDPHSAKQRFGQIGGAGTLGGLAGGLLAERVAAIFGAPALLPVLAALNVYAAVEIRRLGRSLDARGATRRIVVSEDLAPEPARSGLRALATTPYLRHLAGLVLLGTTGAALVDYLFKAQAVGALGRGDDLLRFFAVYYAAIGVVTFVIQTAASRPALERLGLAVTTSTPSLALLAGSAGGLIAPGLQGAIAARGAESVFRGSLFRASYELFYTPIPANEKRAAKSIIDVGFDRFGDAVGGGLVQAALWLPAPVQYRAILAVAGVCSLIAVVVASRLNRGYVQALERSLRNRAVEIELSDVEDMTTRTAMLRLLNSGEQVRPTALLEVREPDAARRPGPEVLRMFDPEMLQILALRSRDRERILRVLRTEEGLSAALVPHVIPLLAWDPVAGEAIKALCRVAEERIGQLVDALIDPNQEFAIRRRLPRVFAICVSQRATDGLVLGLDDLRFEVRYRCARSLVAIQQKNPLVRIDREVIYGIVRRETAVGRPVWESQRLLNRPGEDEDDDDVFVGDFIKDRASRSLAHVFTLLSLVLPFEPLQIAFHGLQADDQHLRGTALEYLDSVLPKSIREPLWPFLEDRRPPGAGARPREEIVADLLKSNTSIMLDLNELKRRAAGRTRQDEAKQPWQTA